MRTHNTLIVTAHWCTFYASYVPTFIRRYTRDKLRKTSVDASLGMLDDFLGITYRREYESDGEFFRRGEEAPYEFVAELLNIEISKQNARDTTSSLEIEWLLKLFNTRTNIVKILEDKVSSAVLFYYKEMLEKEGGFKQQV